MLRMVCVPGHDGLIGEALLLELRTRGVQGIRIDQASTPERTASHATEIIETGLVPFVIVRDSENARWLPAGTWVEVENEPDLAAGSMRGPMSPDEYIDLAQAVAAAVPAGTPIWGPAVSNLNARGFAFLDAVVTSLPAEMGISIHRYPNGGYDERPEKPHDGYRDRDAEVDRLRALCDGRAFGVSEIGYHTAPRCKTIWWFWKQCHRWSDGQVAQNMTIEADFWEAHGAQFFSAYGINDGPRDIAIDRYGWRTLAGAWKPVSDIFREPS